MSKVTIVLALIVLLAATCALMAAQAGAEPQARVYRAAEPAAWRMAARSADGDHPY